jgi:hypothetical protein
LQFQEIVLQVIIALFNQLLQLLHQQHQQEDPVMQDIIVQQDLLERFHALQANTALELY